MNQKRGKSCDEYVKRNVNGMRRSKKKPAKPVFKLFFFDRKKFKFE
jgi:hypothetical protein